MKKQWKYRCRENLTISGGRNGGHCCVGRPRDRGSGEPAAIGRMVYMHQTLSGTTISTFCLTIKEERGSGVDRTRGKEVREI